MLVDIGPQGIQNFLPCGVSEVFTEEVKVFQGKKGYDITFLGPFSVERHLVPYLKLTPRINSGEMFMEALKEAKGGTVGSEIE